MTIFVSIASYCDPVLAFTIERAREAARWPDHLHFGVIDQADVALAVPPAGYRRISPADARGPCWARALAMSLYRGEDWFLQIDSHMDFDAGWDERLIDQARALGPKAVLTAYPNAFVFEGGKPVKKPITRGSLALAVLKGYTFQPGHPVLKFESHAVETDRPLPAIHLGAGCLFAPGRFAVEFPYDPELYFHGEEQSVFLRLYTHGWDVYHPPGMPIYHLYADKPTGAAPRPMHWDHHANWHALERASWQRLSDLIAGNPLDGYGLGAARTLMDYAVLSGISYSRRRIAPRAYLPHVAPPRLFEAHVVPGGDPS